MHVVIVGTYPPTRCGIATFTADVEAALTAHGLTVTVVPVRPADGPGPDPVDSKIEIRRDDPASYALAAAQVNALNCDVVLIQHEFGIFGGTAGSLLQTFAGALTTPYAVTLHTVLPRFSHVERGALMTLCSGAQLVMVFTSMARRLLLDQSIATPPAVEIIPHGAPLELYAPVDKAAIRKRLGLPATGPVLSTFGLLSEGKGIELAIRALAIVRDRLPDVRYVIAGRTHPEVVRTDGERYRERLLALTQELNLNENVVFLNEFLSIEEVAQLLAVTDVFCTPYRGEDQIVSGALTFALAAGCPVVSTPYRYAQEMLSGGAGIIVGPYDSGRFATAIERLLTSGYERRTAARAAEQMSQTLRWTTVGKTIELALSATINRESASGYSPASPNQSTPLVELPTQRTGKNQTV
jgi:glycosyltransferase involved in cell wall biosynthesis